MGRLDGKTALITGAGSGIGAATAELFAAEGAAVSVVDVRAEAAEKVAEGIRRHGGEALGLGGDVSDPVDVERFVAETVAAFEVLHILHNHAGVLLPGTALTLSVEDWQRTMAVNVTGAFLCSKHALPHLIRSGAGSIINTSSTAGVVAEPTSPRTARARGPS